MAVSTITFGDWDLNEVENGEMGLNYYNNPVDDLWAVELDDLRYDSKTMKEMGTYYSLWDDEKPRCAFIDSGNTSI